MNDKYKEILDMAFKALEHSYSPYSKYKVGACVKTKDNKYYLGTNIENASFGLTNCAERTAIFSAYSDGQRKEDIVEVAVVSYDEKITTPCGACRQVLFELVDKNAKIILSNGSHAKITSTEELLPFAFELNEKG